jgi:hypothetical protein
VTPVAGTRALASNAVGKGFLRGSNRKKKAIVLSGGGSLGVVQVGLMRVLLASGVCTDFVVGASVGAINAAYFACAPDLDGVRRWSGFAWGFAAPTSFRSAWGAFSASSNIPETLSTPAACVT